MTNTQWTEGIRIKPATNGWTSLMLCGTDNTATNGTSANSWSMHTYNGAFYLSRNGSDSATVRLQCASSKQWGLYSDQTTVLNVTSSSTSTSWHILCNLLSTNLPAQSNLAYGNAGIRIGRAASEYNSGNLGFHYNSASSPTNFFGLGIYNHSHILIVNGQERVGIKTTTPISELDVAGGISWSSHATSQYNSTDDCIEFIFV